MFLSALFPFFTQERILLDLTPFFLLELDFKTITIYCWYYKTRPRNTNDDTISCSNHWLVKIVFQFRHKTWKSYPLKWHNPFKPNVWISPKESSTGQTRREIGGLRGFFYISCMEIKGKTVISRPFLYDNFTLQPALLDLFHSSKNI